MRIVEENVTQKESLEIKKIASLEHKIEQAQAKNQELLESSMTTRASELEDQYKEIVKLKQVVNE